MNLVIGIINLLFMCMCIHSYQTVLKKEKGILFFAILNGVSAIANISLGVLF